jgi:hypothetical protein
MTTLGAYSSNAELAILPPAIGSPEGVVTAPIGTLYPRSDGGAASTLYVKESGTGNTGWVAAGAGASSLDTLSDVSATSPANGRMLVFNSGTGLWEPGAYAATLTRKTADTVRNSAGTGTTLTDDPHLVVPLLANTLYHIQGVLFYTSAANADIKIAWIYPAATSVDLACVGGAVGSTGATASGSWQTYDDASGTAYITGLGGIDSQKAHILVSGLVEVGANAGNLTLQWAQQTAQATDTTLHNRSHLFATRVS